MSNNKLIRVAFVKFSANGKAYPTRCDREDICTGDEVEVLMRADSVDAFYMDGTVQSIEHHSWNCRCRVMNLTSEVEYSIVDEGVFQRKVRLPTAPVYSIADWRAKKRPYYEGLSVSARSEIRNLQEAASGIDGDDAYIADGVWVKSDGSLDDNDR